MSINNDWNERFSKTQSSQFKTFEIEFNDDSAPVQEKSSQIKKLYEPVSEHSEKFEQFEQAEKVEQIDKIEKNDKIERKSRIYSYDLDGGVLINCKIEEWNKGFTLFNDFLRDAKKYYKKTCINANYIYFFSYRPMYRELNNEQICWYLFWRSGVRNGIYHKTGLSYVFLYLYEQINLADIIGYEKVYENIVKIWRNYRDEFPRIDKYIAEWLIDFSFINEIKINLNDIEDILPHIINIVTIPEVYLREDFFKNKNNIELILRNMSIYDYRKSKFYNDKNEKNKELFDYHVSQSLHAVLSSVEFDEIIKREIDDGVKIRTTRESFMGAVCVYENKKRITIEYKNLYKNFFIRQCVTDGVRYAENIIRDYLGIKSKLTVTTFPEQLKKVIEEYKIKYLSVTKSQKISVKSDKNKKNKDEEIPEIIEFNPNLKTAAEIEKSSWDTTVTLVELQNRDSGTEKEIREVKEEEVFEIFEIEDGDFIAIDTGTEENYEELEAIAPVEFDKPDIKAQEKESDIFDILENLEGSENQKTDIEKFIGNLSEDEYIVLGMLINAKSKNKNFEMLCGEFLHSRGGIFESVIDTINEKAMDFTGDIIYDTTSFDIIEDYRNEIERGLEKYGI